MKIILVTPHIAADGSEALLPHIVADSALTKGSRPFFVPDVFGPYYARPAVAFPVKRLGKGVQERFAHRYLSEPEVAFCMRNTTAASHSDLYAFDGAIHTGDELSGDSAVWHIGDRDMELSLGDTITRLHKFIAEYTLLNTIKMGDLFVMPLSYPDVAIEPDTKASVTCGDRNLLSFNIK